MKTKTIVRYAKSVERMNPFGLKEWISHELTEEHDGEADRDEIHKELVRKVEEWHSGIANAGIFQPQSIQFREPEQLPIIQEKDR